MATLRTWEEKSAILAHCIELEKEGGDILAYLWSENYLTPRATWFNFQREWLGRKPYEYTDGKPRKVKEKRKVVHEKKKLTAEQMVVVYTALAGWNLLEVLKGQGSKNASAAWFYIKKKLQEEDPEKFDRLTKERVDKGMPKKIGPDGKEYEKLELEAGGNYQLSVAETPDAVKEKFLRQIKGEEPIEMPKAEEVIPKQILTKMNVTKPVKYAGMVIREVEGAFGRYRYSDVGGKEYIDFENNDRLDTLSLTVEQWRSFREEQQNAAAILGVEL